MSREHGFLRHFPRRGSASYIMGTPRHSENRRWWTSYRLSFAHNSTKGLVTREDYRTISESAVEYSIPGFKREGFGVGITFTKGYDGDLKWSIYLGRLISIWLHFHSLFTRKHFSASKEKDPKHWYENRRYGFQFFYAGSLLHIWWNACEMGGGKDYPGIDWNTGTLRRFFLGYNRSEKIVLMTGDCIIVMPEGGYPATWERITYKRSHTKFLGKLIDRLPRYNKNPGGLLSCDIAGGIPHEGKGENSYDCGMDGLFSLSMRAKTLDELKQAVRESVLRDRKSYGGPHKLPCSMTVKEAEEWQTGKLRKTDRT